MSATYDNILADLKVRFGDKIYISPKELEPLFGKSEGHQANLRHDNRFPFDVKYFGRSVGVSIYQLAEWLATDEVKRAVEDTAEPLEAPAPTPQARKPKVKTTGKYDYLLAWQTSLNYQHELIDEIETAARTDDKTEELIFSVEDIQAWRKRLVSQYEQIAQIEKKLLLGELDGLEFMDRPWVPM